MKLPTTGKPHDELLAEMRAQQTDDADWHSGKIWSLVYFAGDDVAEVLKEAYTTFFYTNGLSVAAFKSLRKFESEVIAITAELPGSTEAVGNTTAGGPASSRRAIPTGRSRAGQVDREDRADVGVMLANRGQGPFVVTRGMRVAQMVIARTCHAELIEVDELSETDRQFGGFGSTGLG